MCNVCCVLVGEQGIGEQECRRAVASLARRAAGGRPGNKQPPNAGLYRSFSLLQRVSSQQHFPHSARLCCFLLPVGALPLSFAGVTRQISLHSLLLMMSV